MYNPEILVYNVSGIKNMQKKTKTICKALRETGCRRQAGKRKTCVAGHFFATERGRGTDHHHTGDLDAADAWYREKAPREPTHLNVMRRYQYLTQAMVELENGRSDAGGVLPAFPRTPPCPW